MKNRRLLYLILTIAIPLGYTLLGSNSGGITGNSTSGCSCHGPNLSSTNLSITGIPATGYVLGTSYSLTVTVSNAAYTMNNARGGFNITCTEGTFQPSPGVTVSGPSQITHNGPRSMNAGTVSWTVNWTAPTSSTGTVIFHFAGNATNGNNSDGGDQPNYDPFPFVQATPSATAPAISNIAVSNITGTGCSVNASINANGASTGAVVEYGTTTAYGNNAVMNPAPITGTTPTAATANISGLSPNTLYHYRVSAVNSAGTTNSPDDTFRTGAPLLITDFAADDYALYPNPILDVFNIKINENINSHAVHVYNMNGQEIRNFTITSSDKHLLLDFSSTPKGYYILNAVINDRRIFRKIQIY